MNLIGLKLNIELETLRFIRVHTVRKMAIRSAFSGRLLLSDGFITAELSSKIIGSSTKLDYRVKGGFSVDVKTKDRTVLPKDIHEGTAPLYNHEHQRPDYYLFISLLRDKSIDEKDIRRFVAAQIVGAMDITTLDREGIKWKKGQIDPTNGMMFWTDCLNVFIHQLTPLKDIQSIWRG